MIHFEVLDDHHPRVIAAIRRQRNCTAWLCCSSASPAGGQASSYVHVAKYASPIVKSPRSGRRSLGNHLVKHSAARDLDSQSTTTKYDPMPHGAAYNNYSDSNVTKRVARKQTSNSEKTRGISYKVSPYT